MPSTTAHAPLDDYRIHAGGEPGPRAGAELVVYWLQITMRAHDNFALNYAVERADQLGLPLLVYHGLRLDYPWASDRLHTFILESVVDLYADFAAKGIQYAFYLERQARADYIARSPLPALARRAALVVTDFFPTYILPRQTRELRDLVDTPVIAVDSTTVVPLAAHDREYATAMGIRPVLMKALPHYLWPVENPLPRVTRRIDPGFEPTQPTPATIPALVAGSAIDHSVPPAREIRGGTHAGRARLAQFIAEGLPRYVDQRNDPLADATSRLSPYLHFGNLSIHEVLLAARAAGPADQFAKYQDEALVWREISHNFVYRNPRHRTVDGIPGWAREELRKGESDPRPVLYDDATLELARTGDELWNACQRAYLVDGWMHNTLRMLWGKAVLQWTPNAAECLRILEHLNNKYSLDGRDPCTYGGIFWTFGKYDRPFYRRPIYGTVRYQSLRTAKDKFDVPAYLRRYGGEALL